MQTPAIPPIRLAMSAAFVSESGVAVLQKIGVYRSAKSGIPCEFITGKVRVIESRGPAGICPVVVSVKIAPSRRQELQEAFLGMDEDPAGRKLLDEALVAHFEKTDDRNYDDIRQMKKAAADARFNSIK